MSTSRSSGFGGGGVGQKFKPLLSKLVSDWVSSIADKLTILVLRIFSLVRLLFCLVRICLCLLRFACVCLPLFVGRACFKVPKLNIIHQKHPCRDFESTNFIKQ